MTSDWLLLVVVGKIDFVVGGVA